MGKSAKLAFNVAFCGIVTALAAVFMFMSLIPSFAYVVPAFAGIVIWTVSEHMSVKWAYLCYAATALLSVMLIPEPEANLFFIFFFGYYPTLCILLQKIKSKVLCFIVKLAIFNVAVVAAYQLLIILLSAEEMLEGMEFLGELAIYVFWGAGNIAFVIYDICLKTIKEAYIRLIKPKVSAKLK
ncbi:MAG: hypothetical protein IK093_13800 [Ruminiclostridium sp.]|nr:hypothetical protein [Ruminiclostridium sp.]